MTISTAEFWRLLLESRLLAPEQVQQLAGDFGQLKGAGGQATGKTLAQWLVARNVLSRYQATILEAGRAGPFDYGDYKVYDRIEAGRLGGRFRAVHAPTGHPVLLQFLTGPVVSDAQLWALAAGNVLSAAGIVSPHLERFFEPVDLTSFKFVVGEDLRGETVDQRLSTGRLPPVEACRIARLAAAGLAYLHQCGRVHGEVRPDNLFLEAIPNHPGNVKLLYDPVQPPGPIDFAQQQPASLAVRMADYLAPELMSPGKAPDSLTDIYALGCTLYGLLAGMPPFAGGNVQQKMARHAAEAIRPLEAYGVPQPLAQLVAYLMAKNPAVRFQSAAIVAEQLGAFVEPAALYAQPPLAQATLGNFEQFIRHKQTPLAEQAAQPSFVPNAGPMQAGNGLPLFRTRGERVASRLNFDAPPEPAGAPAIVPAVTAVMPAIGVAAPARRGAARGPVTRRRNADQRLNLIIGLVLAGVLGIAAIIGINVLRKSGTVADAGPQPDVGAPPEAAPAMTPTAVTPPGGVANPPASGGAGQTSAPGSGVSQPPGPGKSPETTAVPKPPGSGAESGAVQEVVADDGASLWASPTSGPAVSLRGVPPEAQLILFVRPADLLASSEGERVLAALGPLFATQRAAFETAAGFKLPEIEQLTVSLHNNEGKFPRASFVVKTKAAIPREQLLGRWGNPAAVQEKSQTYYTGGGRAFYPSAAPEDERTFVFGEERDIKEVVAAAFAPPPHFREMERLRRATDSQRHFTLLCYPQFLFNDDGGPLFAGERAKVKKPLQWLLGENLQAVTASGHCGDTFYFELRMLSSLDKRPLELAEELKGRLNQIPTALEDYFVSLNPPPYWKKLAFRYPAMVRELHGQMRVGVENEQAIVNSILPLAAAHNLVLGGELLVATTPGQSPTVAAAPPPAAGPKTFADALQLKTSYSFDNQSLEFAMRDLAADVQSNLKGAPFEFGIKIIGPDLQNDGITRNQSIRDFKQENQTVADILTALVQKANPIPGKAPSDKDQKLVWVVGPDPDNAGKQLVLITTRAAAATKKYTLPAPFVLKMP